VTRAHLGLGANIGNRERNLRMALCLLARRARVVAVSSLYRSPAVVPEGAPPGPDFLNAACEIETGLQPGDLLAFVKEIEREIGRRPAARWAPRPIDIDILLYGGLVLETDALTIPHPLLHQRDFVLVPLAEIAPAAVHPTLHRPIADLAAADASALERTAPPGWDQ